MHANEFVFLMASRGAASVSALHDKLYTRSFAPHLRRDLPYEPHITIARHADYAKLQAAFGEAEREFGGEFSGVIREASLLAVERDGKIEVLESIALNTA
jgi:2'-5' RNA ligase